MKKWMLIAFATLACTLVEQARTVNGQDRSRMFTADRNPGDADSSLRRSLTEKERIEQERRDLDQDIDARTTLDGGETINPDVIKIVRDNSRGVRFEERGAYLHILKLAQDISQKRLERFAAQIRWEQREANPGYRKMRVEDFPQFVDLFTRPDLYRGRPVTIRGILRKLTKFDLGENKLNLDQAYEGWVYTPDSQGNPVVVVFTSKDENLPVQGDMHEEVKFTGYFFKMYGYDAQDTARKAPLILAGDIEWIPNPYQPVYVRLGFEWYAFATMAFLLGWYTLWQSNRREMRPRLLPQIEPDFTQLPPLEVPASDPALSRSAVEPEDS